MYAAPSSCLCHFHTALSAHTTWGLSLLMDTRTCPHTLHCTSPPPQKPSSAMHVKSSSTASACTSSHSSSNPSPSVAECSHSKVSSPIQTQSTLAGPCTWKGCVSHVLSMRSRAQLQAQDFSRSINFYSTLWWSHNWVVIS